MKENMKDEYPDTAVSQKGMTESLMCIPGNVSHLNPADESGGTHNHSLSFTWI